jgi:hypothetical protein
MVELLKSSPALGVHCPGTMLRPNAVLCKTSGIGEELARDAFAVEALIGTIVERLTTRWLLRSILKDSQYAPHLIRQCACPVATSPSRGLTPQTRSDHRNPLAILAGGIVSSLVIATASSSDAEFVQSLGAA